MAWKHLFFLAFFSSAMHNVNAERYALIIAIGDYPTGSGWNDLDVELDVQQMRGALMHHAFGEENITVLKNDEATKDNILKAFAELEKKLRPDDIVFIHYSGHGQQITDLNGDEGDGYDEAICPYDSRSRFGNGYKGECHLLDDEVQQLLKGLSDKVGAKGEVIYAVDACHSSSGVRGPKKRGADSAFVIPTANNRGVKKEAKDHNFLEAEIPANLVAFFGSASGQVNSQVWYTKGQQMGSLSFALAKALKELSERSSYQDLERTVYRIVQMKTTANQTLSTSGNLHKRVFQGHLSVHDNYFKVNKVNGDDVVTVNASLFEGVDVGSQLAFCPPELDEYDKSKAWTTGKVVKADYALCRVKLDKVLNNEQLYKAHVFVTRRNYRLKPISVAVSCTDKALAQEITEQLNNFDTLVRFDADAPYMIFSDSTQAEDIVPSKTRQGSHYVYLSKDIDDLARAEKIRYALIDHLIAQYLLEQKAYNPTLQAKVELINPKTKKAYEMKDSIYQLTEGDQFKIKVSNTGPRPFFFNLLYVQSDGLSGQFEPRIGDGHLEPSECYLQPYDALTTQYAFTATEPFGRDVLVVLLENDEINTQPKLDRFLSELEVVVRSGMKGTRGEDLIRRRRGVSRKEGAKIFQVLIEVGRK